MDSYLFEYLENTRFRGSCIRSFIILKSLMVLVISVPKLLFKVSTNISSSSVENRDVPGWPPQPPGTPAVTLRAPELNRVLCGGAFRPVWWQKYFLLSSSSRTALKLSAVNKRNEVSHHAVSAALASVKHLLYILWMENRLIRNGGLGVQRDSAQHASFTNKLQFVYSQKSMRVWKNAVLQVRCGPSFERGSLGFKLLL